jgi:hypothetical protein
MKNHHKTHKRHRKSLMRRNKKHLKSLKVKSRRYRARGGGNFPYLPQGLVNTWWNMEHGFGKLGNNWTGKPTQPGIFPTDQPELIHQDRPPIVVPDLSALNETADMDVAGMLN